METAQELNKICELGKVYNLTEIDSTLYNKIKEKVPNLFSTFILSQKSNNVAVYQIGNVGNCKDCSPTTYFFIVLQKRIIFFTDNQDLKTPQSELDKLEKEGRLNKAEKTIMIAELKRIVKVNKNAESNREKRRW